MTEVLFNTIFPTFVLIAIGWGYVKLRPEASTRSLSDICLYVGIPSIILNDMVGRDFSGVPLPGILTAAFVAALLPGIMGFIWLKMFKIDHMGLLLPISFLNAANLPIPIIRLRWGAEGVAIAVPYYAVAAILVYIVGVMIIAKENKIKEIFKLPYVYALAIVFLMNSLDLRFPAAVKNLLKFGGDMAYPLMLVVMGIVLGRAHENGRNNDQSNWGLVVPAALIRVIGGFFVALMVVNVLDLGGISRDIVLFYGLMPGAIVTTLFAEKFRRDSELVAYTVFIGTVFSLILIPIFLMLML